MVRAQVESGIDPVLERRKSAGVPTFREAAIAVHTEFKRGWKNGKHQAQWLSTLENFAFPALGSISVSDVEAAEVRDVLAAIWLTKPETARRVRQRITTVIDWAVAKGYRDSSLAMPVIDKALPKQRTRVKHYAAMPYPELPAFFQELRTSDSLGRLALQATILTAARSGEIRHAEWPEIDLEAGYWTIPAHRMKAGREHVVPLSVEAIAIFKEAKPLKRLNSNLVFPGSGIGKPLSDMTLLISAES